MSGSAISEEAMRTSLRDIQLPADAAGGLTAELFATLGLACLAALIVAGLVRLLSRTVTRPAEITLHDRIEAARHLPEPEQRVALLHLLRGLAPGRYAEIRGAIYQPGGGVDLKTLEAEVRAHV